MSYYWNLELPFILHGLFLQVINVDRIIFIDYNFFPITIAVISYKFIITDFLFLKYNKLNNSKTTVNYRILIL